MCPPMDPELERFYNENLSQGAIGHLGPLWAAQNRGMTLLELLQTIFFVIKFREQRKKSIRHAPSCVLEGESLSFPRVVQMTESEWLLIRVTFCHAFSALVESPFLFLVFFFRRERCASCWHCILIRDTQLGCTHWYLGRQHIDRVPQTWSSVCGMHRRATRTVVGMEVWPLCCSVSAISAFFLSLRLSQ